MLIFAAVFVWRLSTGLPNTVGAPVEQPVPFSHKHHVKDDGIDCRYCHTTVEKSSSAGMPPTQVCMTCHSQIFKDAPLLEPIRESYLKNVPIHWNCVNQLPDFVYFNHSSHVKKGIGCVTCHGRIDEMPLTSRAAPLTMQWCLDCHRSPERRVRPREHVFDMHWQPMEDQAALGKKLVELYHIQKGRITDCSTCHR